MRLASCTNTHRDVTDLVNHGMVKNTKTWISWERNIIFLRNKKILNLCLRWHILRSYHFIAEVSFNCLRQCKIIQLGLTKMHFLNQIIMLHSLRLFYEAAWWTDWSYCVWFCYFAYNVFVLWSCSIAGPMGIDP